MKPADYTHSNKTLNIKNPKVNLANAEDIVLLRLVAALRAKPFAILAGHSGTGKSRMVRQLAYMTAATGNHKVLFEDAEGNVNSQRHDAVEDADGNSSGQAGKQTA